MSVVDHSVVDEGAPRSAAAEGLPSAAAGPLHLVAEPSNLVDAAVEVLTIRHQLPRETAADLLAQAAQDRDLPLSDVAKDVVLIGLPSASTQIELRPTPPPAPTSDPDRPGRSRSEAAGTPDPADPVADLAVTASVAAGLLDLLVETTTVPALLTAISSLAADIVPQCEAASVSMVRDGAPAIVAAEDERARHVDETQYRTGEGPYLHAAQTGRTIQIDDITAESGDHAWSQAALKGGFTAILAVPLASDGDVAAVVSLYSSHGTAWSQQSVQTAEILADHAWSAIAIANAQADRLTAS